MRKEVWEKRNKVRDEREVEKEILKMVTNLILKYQIKEHFSSIFKRNLSYHYLDTHLDSILINSQTNFSIHLDEKLDITQQPIIKQKTRSGSTPNYTHNLKVIEKPLLGAISQSGHHGQCWPSRG